MERDQRQVCMGNCALCGTTGTTGCLPGARGWQRLASPLLQPPWRLGWLCLLVGNIRGLHNQRDSSSISVEDSASDTRVLQHTHCAAHLLDTLSCITSRPLANTTTNPPCRYLRSLSMSGAARELMTWDIFQQVDALTALEEHVAAAIMTHMPPDKRAELISLMEPHLAANIMQVGRGRGGCCGASVSVRHAGRPCYG